MIRVEVDRKDLRYVQKKLGHLRKETPKVVCRAVNKTASQSKTMLATKVREEYTVKSGKFKRNMNIKKATYSLPEAEIRAHGSPMGITSFKTSAPKKAGGKAAIIKGNGLKQLIKGQIKAFKGPGGQMYQRKGPKRLPIKKLFSNSAPKMIENDRVYGQLKPEIESILQKNIEAQIKFVTSR